MMANVENLSGEDHASREVSVIVPAHNESRTIERLLESLTSGAGCEELDVVVVCNGCTDDTAQRALAFSPRVTVLETPVPSKFKALQLGDRHCRFERRLHIDADVVVSASSVRALVAGLAEPGILATGPRRDIDMSRSSLLVRWYYEVWLRLPQVENGLFGRGVIALSAAGTERVRELPELMSDDLAVSELFESTEYRIINGATGLIQPPQVVRDLLRRRIRVATGNHQMDLIARRRSTSRTTVSSLAQICAGNYRLIPKAFVFLGVSVIAGFGAQRRIRSGDYVTWLRDDSSRSR